MYLGLDLGTSSVKALIVDASGTAVASQSVPLQVIRRQAGWSEQDPQSWWDATNRAVRSLGAEYPDLYSRPLARVHPLPGDREEISQYEVQ